MKRTIGLVLLFLSGIAVLSAQQELGTSLIFDNWSANRLNPALWPEGKIVVGGPGIYNNLLVTNITYNDLFSTSAEGKTVLHVNQAIALLDDQNQVHESMDIESLSLGLRFGKVALSLSHAVRFNAFLDYPKTLPQLIWQGNAQFIGQEVGFGPNVQLNSFNELSLGLAYEITKGLTLAGKVKYLNGIASVSTERTDLRLYTSDDAYQLTLNADYRVNSAGALDYDGFSELTLDYDFGRFKTENFLSGNSGFAYDLGAKLELGRLTVAASALDLGGRIDWEKKVKNYTLNGVYDFEGLDVAQNILDDNAELGSALDSLKAIYQPEETSAVYSTQLLNRYYASATYDLTEQVTLGLTAYTDHDIHNDNQLAIGLGARFELLSWLDAGAVYGIRQKRYDNLGLNARFTLGPVELLTATDNILTVIQPKKSHSANFRIGLSAVFGRAKAENSTRSFF